jgi:hypothetical protein
LTTDDGVIPTALPSKKANIDDVLKAKQTGGDDPTTRHAGCYVPTATASV